MNETVLSLFNKVLNLTPKQRKELIDAVIEADSIENAIFRMDYIASYNKKEPTRKFSEIKW